MIVRKIKIYINYANIQVGGMKYNFQNVGVDDISIH